MGQWSRELGLKFGVLAMRLDRYGWSVERALTFTKRETKSIEINGETKSMADWCRHFGVKYGTAIARIRKGWEPATAVTTPA